MKKFIISFIFILILTLILISCGENNDNNDNSGENGGNANINADAADDKEGEAGEEAGEPRIEPELPDEDFGGYIFTFLTHLYEGDDWINPTPLEIVAEEITGGDPINDAVYRRNMKITEKFNFGIRILAESDEAGAMRKAVGAGDSIYDAAVMFNHNIPSIVTNALLVNVGDLKYIDLSKPWWDPAVNALSIDNKNYLLGGDLLILDNEATNAVLFNKELLSDLGIGLPYDTVKEGKWTFDLFNEYIKGASRDLNGDGRMTWTDDRWGFIAFNDTMLALLAAGGGSLALKDSDDIPYMTLTEPRNLSVIDKLMDIMYNKEDVLNVQADINNWELWGQAFYGAFEENRSVFQWARVRAVEKFRGMDADFGIIPMPKFDENQENYRSLVNPFTGALLGVPKSAENLERISVILEALAAESRYTLQPAYYDVVLTRKFARDAESEDMLGIIFNSRVYDVGAVYSFGGVYMDFVNMANRSNRDIASFYERGSGRMEKGIENIVEIFRGMD